MMAGVISLGAFSLTTLLSIGPIRRKAYELFLFSHILLIL
jgi:hypothetical protein